jgi:hypothetical protein
MKTFPKLIIAVAGIFVGSSGSLVYAASDTETIAPVETDKTNKTNKTDKTEYTPAQAAAIKELIDAVATGNEANIKSIISQKIAQFPEITGNLVSAGLNVPGISLLLQKVIVRSAVISAPTERSSILMAIQGNKVLLLTAKITLSALVKQTLKEQLEWKVHENYVKPPGVS